MNIKEYINITLTRSAGVGRYRSWEHNIWFGCYELLFMSITHKHTSILADRTIHYVWIYSSSIPGEIILKYSRKGTTLGDKYGDHSWGPQLGTTLGDHIVGSYLGTIWETVLGDHIEDRIWGQFGRTYLGITFGGHIWWTHFGTTFGTKLGDNIWGPHLGTIIGDHT